MLVTSKHWHKFFSGDTIEWINYNSKREVGKAINTSWKLIFGEAVRKFWFQRNAYIFRNEECDAANLYWNIMLSVHQFEESMNVLKFSSSTSKEISINWKPPTEGWFKCNVDGSSKANGLWRFVVVSLETMQETGFRVSL